MPTDGKYCRKCGRDLQRVPRNRTYFTLTPPKDDTRDGPVDRHVCHYCEISGDSAWGRAIANHRKKDGLLDIYADERWQLRQESICPHCWQTFQPEEVLWISRHVELLGDDVLGPDVQKRFSPTRFNVAGNAIDLNGMECTGMACPHCHLPVVRSVLEYEPYFISVVGETNAGKSYFLASMTWSLRRQFPQNFGLLFVDADTVSNRLLIENERILFSGSDGDSIVRILNTQLEGAGYNTVNLGAHPIILSRPLLFNVSQNAFTKEPFSPRLLCLYDNAGEHFNPSTDPDKTPSINHLSKANVIWFLFDPTLDERFRKAMGSKRNALHVEANSRQETILNGAATRIANFRHRSARPPLVVIVPKLDLWKHMLSFDFTTDPVKDDPTSQKCVVDVSRIDKVSVALRDLLEKHVPEFVASAKNFDPDVRFIPTSATGCAPEVDPENGHLGFRKKKLNSMWITAPMLYSLGCKGGLLPAMR